MSEGQRLLDVFVSVRPDPEMLEAVKAAHETLISDLQKRLAEVSQAIGATTRTHVTEVSNAVQVLTDRLNALQQASQALQSQNRLTGGGGRGGASGGGGAVTSGSSAPPPQSPPPKTQAELELDRISERRAGIEENIRLLREANSLEISRLRNLGQKEFASPYEQQNLELRAIVLEMRAMDAEEVNLLTNDARRQEYLDFYTQIGRRVDNARESVERFADRVRQVSAFAVSQPGVLSGSKFQEDIAKLFRAQNIRAGIALGAPQERPTGLPSSGALADDLRAQEQVVRENAANVKRLRSEYDGTKYSVDNLRDAIDELANSQKRLSVLQLAAKDQGNLYRGIAEGARDASIAAGRLSISLKDIGDVGLRDDIVQLRRDVQDFERELTRLQSKGEFNFVVQSSGLDDLLQRLQSVTARSGTATTSKEKIVETNENLRASIRLDEIKVQELNEQYISRTTAKERAAIVSQRAELARNQALIQEANRDRDNSLIKEQELNALLIQRKALLGTLSADLQDLASRTNASFNRLQNTAFQVGQAFEDFAVGFQLNGFAGGIRGAANNISFIAQDIASIYVSSDKISQKWKLIAGVGTGIGAALAVTILPPTIAWLESLNDISIEIEDISRKMQDMSDESRRVAEANQKTRETLRGIGETDSFESVLQQLRDLREETQDTAKTVADTINNIFASDQVDGIRKSFGPISAEIRKQLEDLSIRAKLLQINLQPVAYGIDLFREQKPSIPFDEAIKRSTTESDKQIQSLLDTYILLGQQLDVVQSKAASGVPESSDLKRTSDLFVDLTKQIDEFAKSADVSDETKNFAETFRSNITPLQKAFEDLLKPLKEVEEVLQRRFSAAVDAAQRKTEQLAERQQLLRLQLQGQASEQSTALLDIREFSAQYQDMIEQTLEFYAKSQGVTSAQVEGLREVLRGQANMEIGNKNLTEQKSVLDRIQSVEERIAGLRERSAAARSQMVSPEDFAQQLQQNVLSIEPVDKNTDALEKATNELIELRLELVKLQQLEEIRVQRGEIAEFNRNAVNLGPQIPRIPSSVDRALLEAERALPFLRAPTVSDLMRMTPIVAPMGGIGGAAGMLDVMKGIPGQGSISDLVSVGVESGIRKALEGIAPALFNRIEGVSEAVKTKDMSPRAQ